MAPVAGLITAMTTAVLIARRNAVNVIPMSLAASAVSAIWLVPLADSYRDFGGFRRITTIHAHESALQLIAALGPLVILGAIGLIRSSRSLPADARWNLWAIAVVPVTLTGAAALLTSSAPLGAPALTRPVRYLPAVGLALALAGGLGASTLVMAARRRRVLAAAAVAFCFGALPIWVAVRTTLNPPQAVTLDCGAPLPFTATSTVAVLPHSPSLQSVDGVARAVFAATGATAVYRSNPRIRFRSIYGGIPNQRRRRAWIRTLLSGGPMPPGVRWIVAPAGRLRDPPVAICDFNGRRYVAVQR